MSDPLEVAFGNGLAQGRREAQAEIERLCGIVQFGDTASRQQREGFQTEIERLRAEAANWKRIASEVTIEQHKHRLEAERLKAALAGEQKQHLGERVLVSEIERLARAALEGK